MTKPALTRQDWIDQAFVALAELGPRGLRVEPLARSLGASKGSFYWHFRDLADLQVALTSQWEAAVTDFDAMADLTLEQLLAMVPSGLATPQISRAMRDWAREAPRVAAVIARVDRRRHVFLATQMAESGYDSARLPLLVHAVQLGLDQLECSLGPMPEAARLALLPKPKVA